MSIPPPLWDALDDSISSGVFIDTKFIVFSKMVEATGRIERPRALFANSTVVKGVPYLASRFVDDDKVTGDAEVSHVDDYDYDSDSDFEDNDLGASISCRESSDFTLSEQLAELRTASDPLTTVHQAATPNASAITSPPQVAHTIVIKDVAFVTFHALLLYLYTHEIVFVSHGSTFPDSPEVGAAGPNHIQRPSAKSIYRLASKYNIPYLRELALAEIRRNLKEYCLRDEAFSKLAAQYPELRDLFLQRLKEDIQSSCFPVTELQQIFNEYASGKLQHAQDAIVTLYDLLSGPRPLSLSGELLPTSQPLPISSAPPDKRIEDWADLKDAVVGSLCSGSFIDSKFYAPVASAQPSDPPNLQPLYFCGFINPTVTQKLNSGLVETKPNPRSNTVDATGVNGQMIPALKFGDWQSWRSIFLYIYTTEVSFTTLLNPPPTTPLEKAQYVPKPVYVLSDKIGLLTLRDLALSDIMSKMNNENIVEEFFSKFSSENRKILELQHQLLQQGFKCTKTTSEIRQKILESSLGKYPHHAAAIILAFEGVASSTSFSVASATRPNRKSHDLPAFVPYIGEESANSSLTSTYQSISCMPYYHKLSFEEIRVHHYCGIPLQLLLGKPTPHQSLFS